MSHAASPVEQVVDAGLCTGCGLCQSLYGSEQVRMQMTPAGFLRPQVLMRVVNAAIDREFEQCCPGRGLDLRPEPGVALDPAWGPLVAVRTGWSSDAQTRFKGSSGGGISALLEHLLASGAVDFVAHIEADPDHPLRNRLRRSRTTAEVLQGAGSRYSPAAPLAELGALFASGQRFAFVGKPCDAAALQAHLRLHPERRAQVVAVLAFMCAGTPSEQGSLALLQRLGTRLEDTTSFSYRGNGWPGMATAVDREGQRREIDYNSSWGQVLNRHLQFRCKVCPDGTGEFADVVCADAWYGAEGYPEFAERDGRSLILSRSLRGEALVTQALAAGALHAEPADATAIAGMQPYQLNRKRLLLSRLAALLLRGRMLPRFRGLRLLANARHIGLRNHLRNLAGTLKRLPQRGES